MISRNRESIIQSSSMRTIVARPSSVSQTSRVGPEHVLRVVSSKSPIRGALRPSDDRILRLPTPIHRSARFRRSARNGQRPAVLPLYSKLVFSSSHWVHIFLLTFISDIVNHGYHCIYVSKMFNKGAAFCCLNTRLGVEEAIFRAPCSFTGSNTKSTKRVPGVQLLGNF